MTQKLLVWLDEIDKNDHYFVGEKAALIGNLLKEGFPLFPGFVITPTAFSLFIKENQLQEKAAHIKGGMPSSLPPLALTKQIHAIVEKARIPAHLTADIFSAYTILGNSLKNETVLVTESTNPVEKAVQIQGEANLFLALKDIWTRHLANNPQSLTCAILVQKKLPLQSEGILFTTHPEGNREKIRISFPHSTVDIDKVSSLPSQHTNLRLSPEQVQQLTALSKKIEGYFYFPQEVRFGWLQSSLYLQDIKPLTPTLSTQSQRFSKDTTSSLTATRIYTIFDNTNLAIESAKCQVDGIGFFSVDSYIKKSGVHPKKLLREGNTSAFIDTLFTMLATTARAFSPRPVIYKLSNLTTQDYARLQDGKHFEIAEPYPRVGYRGAHRHINDPEALQLEIDVIKHARNKLGLKNIWLMLPFVRSTNELVELKQTISNNNLYRSASFNIWMSVDTPENCILLDEYIGVGIDGVAVDMASLQPLLLGVEKENPEMSTFDSNDTKAIDWALKKVIHTAQTRDITSSLYNFDPSHTTLLESAISYGITSVFIPHNHIDTSREYIARIEKERLAKKYDEN